MDFWHTHMPDGMVLRSRVRSSSIADPDRELSIPAYDPHLRDPMQNAPLDRFLDYAHWFQERAVPEVDLREVTSVETAGGALRAHARGRRAHRRRPCGRRGGARSVRLASAAVRHARSLARLTLVDHAKLGMFADQEVVVVGGGQSALESAALLHEAGADVEVVAESGGRSGGCVGLGLGRQTGSARASGRRPTWAGAATGWIAAYPDTFRRLPAGLQSVVARRCTSPRERRGSPAAHGRPDHHGRHRSQRRRRSADDCGIALDDGNERIVDHVLLGTGYRVDVAKYPFLAAKHLQSLDVVGGYPVLGPGLESRSPACTSSALRPR